MQISVQSRTNDLHSLILALPMQGLVRSFSMLIALFLELLKLKAMVTLFTIDTEYLAAFLAD